MFQVFFGDDEHTAVDGPYKRLMKVRKWIYITSAWAVLLAFGLYDSEATNELLKIVDIPIWLIEQFSLAALFYLSFQYSLLLLQLAVTYDIVLAARFTYRQADEAANAAERFRSAEERLATAREKVLPERAREVGTISGHVARKQAELEQSRHELLLVEDRSRLLALEDSPEVIEAAEQELHQARQRVRAAESASIEARRQLEAVKRGRTSKKSSDQDAAERELWAAELAFSALQRRDPAKRRGYRFAEIVLDAIRVLPPLFVAGVAGWRLLGTI